MAKKPTPSAPKKRLENFAHQTKAKLNGLKLNAIAKLHQQSEDWQQRLFPTAWEDGAFMDDVRQATLRGAAPISNILFWVCAAFIAVLLVLSSIVKIDEVTHGMGTVIPSSSVQILQNLDGGIVADILAEEGEVVRKGDPIVRIDSTGFSSSYAEKQTRIAFLGADLARLDALIDGQTPNFAEAGLNETTQLLEDQQKLFESRQQEMLQAEEVFQQQINQKLQDFNEALEREQSALKAFEFISKELEMSEGMAAKGVIPEMTLLQLKRKVNDVESEFSSAKLAVPRTQSALEEAQARLKEFRAKTIRELRDERSEKADELNRLSENIVAVRDKVERSVIRAPVPGTISRLLVNTIGGVIKPGEDVVELIPIEDQLLVEARIRPQDIAFIRPRQEVMVKITAYDYSIYGGLKGHLTSIGTNTVVDEDGQAYYPVKVQTQKGALTAPNGDLLPIIPGMVANVDILTGKRTVLNYILKPYYKVRDNALRER